ncbi:MAG: hypothetical protein ACXWKC_05540 [Xanthobacteraceae bacterium]
MRGWAAAVIGGTFAATGVGWAADMPVKARIESAEQALAPQQPVWTLTTSTEVRYFSWQGTRGTPGRIEQAFGHGSGTEVYVPYAVQLVGRPTSDWKVEILGRGGWVWARQNTAGLSGEVETTTDTVASTTVTYYGLRGFQPFVATSVNLPTGRSVLNGRQANARMDADLVDIASFGEGFNIGPTVGVNIPITTTLVVTTSAGYTWRDRYPRENSLAALDPNVQLATNINPGEVWTANTSVANKWGQWSGSIGGTASFEGRTSENGTPLYKPGDRYLATATLSYTWGDGSQTTVNGSYAHSSRNEVLFLGGTNLVNEILNSNSDVTRVGIQHLVPVGQLTIGPTGSFLVRNHNAYDITTLQFVPEKERWTAGFIARYAASDKLIFNARLDHVWTYENQHDSINGFMFSALANGFVVSPSIPVISSNGWQAVVGATARY